MATNFSANQYEKTFKSKSLQNWEVPHWYKDRPEALHGFTNIVSNCRGHLYPNIKRGCRNPWGDFVGTWDMPNKIPGNRVVVPTARRFDVYDKMRRAMNEAHDVMWGLEKNAKRQVRRASLGPCMTRPAKLGDPMIHANTDPCNEVHADCNVCPCPDDPMACRPPHVPPVPECTQTKNTCCTEPLDCTVEEDPTDLAEVCVGQGTCMPREPPPPCRPQTCKLPALPPCCLPSINCAGVDQPTSNAAPRLPSGLHVASHLPEKAAKAPFPHDYMAAKYGGPLYDIQGEYRIPPPCKPVPCRPPDCDARLPIPTDPCPEPPPGRPFIPCSPFKSPCFSQNTVGARPPPVCPIICHSPPIAEAKYSGYDSAGVGCCGSPGGREATKPYSHMPMAEYNMTMSPHHPHGFDAAGHSSPPVLVCSPNAVSGFVCGQPGQSNPTNPVFHACMATEPKERAGYVGDKGPGAPHIM